MIWRAAPCTNEGKRVSFSQDTRRGLTSAISSHFWDFRTFFSPFAGTSQEQPSQASASAARTCSCREESGARALFLLLLLLFGKSSIVTRMLGLSLGCVLPSEMPPQSTTGDVRSAG